MRDAVIAEEWVMRNEPADVEQSGHDIEEVARRIAFAPSAGLLGERGARLLAEPPADPLVSGVSGDRPDHGREEARLVVQMIDEVWNQHLGNVTDYVNPDIGLDSTRYRTFTRESGYKTSSTTSSARSPAPRVDVYDVAFNEDPFHGTRVSVTWLLRGTDSGIPMYGAVTGSLGRSWGSRTSSCAREDPPRVAGLRRAGRPRPDQVCPGRGAGALMPVRGAVCPQRAGCG